VLFRAGFFALVAFFGFGFAFALVLVLVPVLAVGRFFDLAAFRLLVARVFVREDRVFAMESR
jgi:hypothetical protein